MDTTTIQQMFKKKQHRILKAWKIVMELAYTEFWEEVDFCLCFEGRGEKAMYKERIKVTCEQGIYMAKA